MGHPDRRTKRQWKLPRALGKWPRALGNRSRALLLGVSCGVLAAGVTGAIAGSYTAANETQLRDAIAQANGDPDSAATITLTGHINVSDPSAFPAFGKPITIDTGTFTLAGTDLPAGTGTSLAFLGGQLLTQGTVRGGNVTSTTSNSPGGVGLVLSNGSVDNNAAVAGGGGASNTGPGTSAGAGGAGMSLTNATLVNRSSITGGSGGIVDVLNSASNAMTEGGAGGAGLVMSGGALDNRNAISGGVGGGFINKGAIDNRFAGMGGLGAALTGGQHVNSGTISGGTGSEGSNAGASGNSVGGGGLTLAGGASLLNNGVISGASGIAGGGTQAGSGSAGGFGATVTGSTLENAGTVQGGNAGGTAGNTAGSGIIGSNATIINSGTIGAGRLSLGAGALGNAVLFSSGVNRLELHAGSVINGNVLANGTSDTLALGGSTDSSFNAAQIGSTVQYRGFEAFEKVGASTWILSGTILTRTPWTLLGGTLSVAGNFSLGANTGALTFNGGVLQVTGTTFTSTGRAITWGGAGGGFDIAAAGNTFTVSQALGAGGALAKFGPGTLVLSGANAHTGGTVISGGTLSVSSAGNLGTGGVTFGTRDGLLGTLRTTGSFAWGGGVALNANGTIQSDLDLTLSGVISGPGALTKTGNGRLILTGDSSAYAGLVTVSAGILKLGSGGGSGSITADVLNNGALVFDRSDIYNFDGLISGSGSVSQIGGGTTVLAGANTYSGPTSVQAGSLLINGDQSGATGLATVASGATLGGTGTIGGDVIVADGGTLSPGGVGAVPGTLTINGSLTLNATSQLNYNFGAANVVGRDYNDHTVDHGDLILDGVLNVTESPGGSFSPGIYRIISYGGALTDNGLTLGALPAGDFAVQTAFAHQVNLVNQTGVTLSFWDGPAGGLQDGDIHGGDGPWRLNDNQHWTDDAGALNGPYRNGAFAVFSGQAGTVTIDNSNGQVEASGLQIATHGYVLAGDPLKLVGGAAIIRVGDGSGDGAGMTATIQADVIGDAALVKEDMGTLVLTGANAYAGGTVIRGGTLSVASDGQLGAASGGLTFDSKDGLFGTLHTTASFTSARSVMLAAQGTVQTDADLALSGTIAGPGGLTKTGPGTLTLTGANAYAGGTLVQAGTVSVAADSHLGAPSGRLTLDGGTLANTAAFSSARPVTLGAGGGTFRTGAGLTLTGVIDGAGGLTKTGAGKLDLTAANIYTGSTAVQSGTLAINGSIRSAVTVASGATLAGTGTIFGEVTNSGTVSPGNSIDALNIVGNYVGQGGRLAVEAVLGTAAATSAADRLVIDSGLASGGTGVVVSASGPGGLTAGYGIPVVVVANGGTTTTSAFTLTSQVAAGPYEYLLYRGSDWGANGAQANNWYLSSVAPNRGGGAEAPGGGDMPLYRPEAPVYAAAPAMARRLGHALLGTFHERIGDQALLAGSGGFAGAWGRWIGQKTERDLGGSLAPSFDGTIAGLQAGLDLYARERAGGGQDRFGMFFAYARGLGDVKGFALGQRGYPAGKMDLSAYSIGATWTHFSPSGWYVDAVVMGTNYDGEPSSNRGNKADINGYGLTASLEGGYPLALGHGLALEPQAQLVWQSLRLDRTRDQFATIDYSTPGAVSGRLGLRLTGTFQAGGMRIKPSLTANLWQEFLGTDKTIFSGTALSSGGKNATSVEIAGGLAAQLSERVGLWGSASYLTDISGLRQEAWRGNVGLRVTW